MVKDEKKGFLRIYLIIVLVYAIYGLLDSVVFTGAKEKIGDISVVYQLFSGVFALSVFVLSIVALIVFIQRKYSKITLVMPIYHIAAHVFVFMYGFLWGAIMALKGVVVSQISINSGLIIFGIVSSLFELCFVSYLLYRFR